MEQLKVEIRDVNYVDKKTGKDRTFKGLFIIIPGPYGGKEQAIAVKALSDQGKAKLDAYIRSV